MSRLDIVIEFDRADRAYRGGEHVTGKVHVQANQDVKCDGLWIEYYWQTHGRGNTYRVSGGRAMLTEGSWQGGRRETFPFKFQAPAGPPTFRGNLLNIDHYVNVHADVPWAFDPKREAEYLVRPGVLDNGPHVPQLKTADEPTPPMLKRIGLGGGVFLIFLGMMCGFPFGFVLMPVGLVIVIMCARSIAVEKRLGIVEVEWGSRRVRPGGHVPLSLQFTPHKQVQVNEITATLTAREECVSGSGTNKTTHKHTLFDKKTKLSGTRRFEAGGQIKLDYEVPVPMTEAFSLDTNSNDIKWELALRIDIPKWPDWTRKTPILVVPSVSEEADAAPGKTPSPEVAQKLFQVLGPLTQGAQNTVHERPPNSPPQPTAPAIATPRIHDLDLDQDQPAPPAADPQPVVAPAIASPQPSIQVEEQPVAQTLLAVFRRVEQAPRFGDARDELVKAYGDKSFPCHVAIESTSRTYGYDVGEAYRDGRTLIGKIRDSENRVAILFKQASNATIDALKPGDEHVVECTLDGWDRLYDRLKMREA